MQHDKEVFIKFKDGDKEAELTLKDFHQENQLALIDGLFKFFEVDVAFKELAEISLHTRRAYREFYDQTQQIEFTETNEKEPISTEIMEQAKVTENWETPSTTEESHWYTGIKVKNGVEHFKLRYRCPSCGKTSNLYVKKTDRYINCYDCGTKMMIKPATTEELTRDAFGNYFVAGTLETSDKAIEI